MVKTKDMWFMLSSRLIVDSCFHLVIATCEKDCATDMSQIDLSVNKILARTLLISLMIF